jgi:hypothetical protein
MLPAGQPLRSGEKNCQRKPGKESNHDRDQVRQAPGRCQIRVGRLSRPLEGPKVSFTHECDPCSGRSESSPG